MRKLALLLLIAILMAVTNPTPDDFRSHVREEVLSGAKQAGHSVILDAADKVKAMTSIDLVTWYANQIIESSGQRNYILFSIYTATVEGRRQTWIGLFRRFIKLVP